MSWNIFCPTLSAIIKMTGLITDSVCVIFPPLSAGFYIVEIILSCSLWNFNFPLSYFILLSLLHLCLSTSQRLFSLFFKAHWSQNRMRSHCLPVCYLANLQRQCEWNVILTWVWKTRICFSIFTNCGEQLIVLFF